MQNQRQYLGTEPRAEEWQSHQRPSDNQHPPIELGDIPDDQSDQVLLGSAFDDTRNVHAALNILNASDTARRQNEQSELTVVDENEAAKTQRVHEAWRRR